MTNKWAWISVDLVTPKPYSTVLAFVDWRTKIGYINKSKEWWFYDGGKCENSNKVTHWMPMPDPPVSISIEEIMVNVKTDGQWSALPFSKKVNAQLPPGGTLEVTITIKTEDLE